MELQRLLIWVCFALCLGLTSGGVLIFFKLKNREGLPVVRYFQYYLVMIYAYAYYALWSEVFVGLFFDESGMENETVDKVSNLLFLISTPFLIIGLIMLIAWALRMLKSRSAPRMSAGGGFVLLLLVLIIWLDIPAGPESDMNVILHLMIIAVVVFLSIQFYFSSLHYLEKRNSLAIATLLLLFGSIHFLAITWLPDNLYVQLGFIMLFFLINSLMGVILVYTGDFPQDFSRGAESLSIDSFAERYGITAREQEVILEICKGKSNREIADTLFVTVQTIKDHTHRIYQKTDVKNRNQLAMLFRNIDK